MKSVLITGVSRGIGLSIAKEFIQNDYFVFGTSRSKFDLSKALESNNCKHLIVDVNAVSYTHLTLPTKRIV